MAKSPVISSTPSGNVAGAVTTVAGSKGSRKSNSKPISKGAGPSEADLINIFMNDLNGMQERFGRVYFVPPDGPDEPALLVLPKSLTVCIECGVVIKRSDGDRCRLHQVKEIAGVQAAPAPVG